MKPHADTIADQMGRLRELAQRCRELAEMTAVPDITRELLSIAEALEKEAAPAPRS